MSARRPRAEVDRAIVKPTGPHKIRANGKATENAWWYQESNGDLTVVVECHRFTNTTSFTVKSRRLLNTAGKKRNHK